VGTTTEEFVVTPGEGNPFSDLDLLFPGYFNPGYRPEPIDAGSGGGGDPSPTDPTPAFAPPVPTVLPEFEVNPPARTPPPATPTPRVTPPPTITSPFFDVLPRLLPLAGLIIPMATGNDELPTGFAIRDNQYRPPTNRKPPGATAGDPFPFDLYGYKPDRLWDIWEKIVEFPWSKVLRRVGDLFGRPPTGPDVRNSPLLDEILITGDRFTLPKPSPIEVPFVSPSIFLPEPIDFGFGSTSSPFGTPGIDPVPTDFPLPAAEPERRARPDPKVTPSPDPFGSPLPDPFGNPAGNPSPEPFRPTQPSPDTRVPILTDPFGPIVEPVVTARPPVSTKPTDFADFVPLRDPFPDPLAEFGPSPLKPDKETCSCAPKKKEKKKKRSDRQVCYRGTYRQNRRGITYNAIEEVPCENPKRKRTTRKKQPTLGDLAKEIFGP